MCFDGGFKARSHGASAFRNRGCFETRSFQNRYANELARAAEHAPRHRLQLKDRCQTAVANLRK
eukprot:11199441-Lingulodinium_polyedra.AAC.1